MLHYFKATTVFFIWVLIALSFHHFISFKTFDTCNLDSSTVSIRNDSLFLVTDDAQTILYNYSEGLTIQKGSITVSSIEKLPLLKDRIISILTTNYSKELLITGKYLQEETTPNLGLKRAKIVKNELITTNLSELKIKVNSKISNFTYSDGGFYNNGISLKINTLRKSTIDSLENSIENKTLYIEFENDTLLVNKNLIKFTTSLKQYLNKYTDKKIQIIGHTDNLGYFEDNLIIGLIRANKVKDYFVIHGIDSTKIETLTKGESEPIANKTTEKGRALNRRIELKIN